MSCFVFGNGLCLDFGDGVRLLDLIDKERVMLPDDSGGHPVIDQCDGVCGSSDNRCVKYWDLFNGQDGV